MNCPSCNTPNDPQNQFCVKCRYSLTGQAHAPRPLARSYPDLLGVLTARLLILLVGSWLLKLILNWLPFTRQLVIPEINLPVSVLITSIIFFIVFFLLVNYARVLQALWPRVYPKYQSLAPALSGLVYLFALVALYYALLPILGYISTGEDVTTLFQAVFFVVALVLLVNVALLIYRRLPDWLANLRMDHWLVSAAGDKACLNCGTINPRQNKFCSNCGKVLQEDVS